jgi:hypothetical protein
MDNKIQKLDVIIAAPELGSTVYYAAPFREKLYASEQWQNKSIQCFHLALRLVFLTKEEAIQAAERMIIASINFATKHDAFTHIPSENTIYYVALPTSLVSYEPSYSGFIPICPRSIERGLIYNNSHDAKECVKEMLTSIRYASNLAWVGVFSYTKWTACYIESKYKLSS